MHSSAMSGFLGSRRVSIIKRGYLVATFRSDLMAQSAELYANAVNRQGDPLVSCARFMNCTKIKMCRPGGPNCNQRSVCSCHKDITAPHIGLYQHQMD